MELSKRLYAVAGLVTPGGRLADIGTDHAYVPIYLAQTGSISGAVAMDVNRGPLLRAQEHICENGLESCIAVRLSDGLQKLEAGEADTVLIAGMGGALTIRILEAGSHVLPSVKELILQPQSEIFKVREWLEAYGYIITEEDMVCEDGKYYQMMRAVAGKTAVPMDEVQLWYGPCLLDESHPVLKEYLTWERTVKQGILQQLEQAKGEQAMERRQEVYHALERNREALKRIEQKN